MNKEKVLVNYFDSAKYNDEEILESVENTKKEFDKKKIDVNIKLNEYGVYVITYYFKTKENIFQKIIIKIKEKRKAKKQLLLKEKNILERNLKKEKSKKIKKTRKQKQEEKLQKRMEKYSGNKYGKYKQTREYRPY